jgi:exodeoxyribonuclease V alpha subunit
MNARISAGTATALEHLSRWADRGHLRRLDLAFASLIADLDPGSGPSLPIAAALLSRMESQGHTALPIAALAGPELSRLGWPAELADEVAALWQGLPQDEKGWATALGASAAVMRVADRQTMAGAIAPDPTATPADQGQPLVLDGPRLYLRRFWRDQRTVDDALKERCEVTDAIEVGQIRAWIDRLFDESKESYQESHDGPDWQRIACAIALRGRLTIITGGPGTGKTYAAARLLALLFATNSTPERLRVALAAPTGKAAARLRQSIDQSLSALQKRLGDAMDLAELTRRIGGAQTLHRLLGSQPDSRRFRHHAGNRLDADVVIVDEASMIHLEMMAALLAALAPQTRLILLGDKDQLASVEPGAVLGELCADAQLGQYSAASADWLRQASGETVPDSMLDDAGAGVRARSAASIALSQQTVMLRRSRRFDGPIAALAHAVNEGRDPKQPARLIAADTSGAIWWPGRAVQPTVICDIALNGRPGASASYRDYCWQIGQCPALGDRDAHAAWVRSVIEAFDRFRVLCAIREGPWGVTGINQAIERALGDASLLKTSATGWYVGRPVMVTRNDRSLGVFNGDVGITLPAHDKAERLKVYFLDGDQLRAVSVTRLSRIETAYAMTVHKSQGSEFEHTALVLPERGASQLLSRELVYTGITRARKALSLMVENEAVLEAAVGKEARG